MDYFENLGSNGQTTKIIPETYADIKLSDRRSRGREIVNMRKRTRSKRSESLLKSLVENRVIDSKSRGKELSETLKRSRNSIWGKLSAVNKSSVNKNAVKELMQKRDSDAENLRKRNKVSVEEYRIDKNDAKTADRLIFKIWLKNNRSLVHRNNGKKLQESIVRKRNEHNATKRLKYFDPPSSPRTHLRNLRMNSGMFPSTK